jgi:hypothetical protein
VDDIILSVNGVNVENVEHSFVIRLLKEAKEFIHLVVKRKISNWNKDAECNITTYTNGCSTNLNPELAKRRNMAMQQTAANVIANYNSNGKDATNEVNLNEQNMTQSIVASQQQQQQQQTQQNVQKSANNPMNTMLNTASTLSSLKPIKVTLNKKDKKDTFGIVLGCKYFIKDILPNSLAAAEANLRKGDVIVKLNDLSFEQLSFVEAKKLLSKPKENKLNLIVRRNSVSSSMSSGSSASSSSSSSGDICEEDFNPITIVKSTAINGEEVVAQQQTQQQSQQNQHNNNQQQQQQHQPKPPPRSHSPRHHNGLKKANSNYQHQNGHSEATNNGLLTSVTDSRSIQQPLSTSAPNNTANPTQTAPSLFVKQLFKPIKSNHLMTNNEIGLNESRATKFYSK